jgi:DNA-binding MarR family transcriptional regulator
VPDTGPPTILFEVFWTHQRRKRLVEQALAGLELPPEDYPFYVTIGADGPLTPTALAELLMMPLSTVLFRFRRLERRGHAERVPNPGDGRSFLMRLTAEGQELLDKARPAFRTYAEAVESRLGQDRVDSLRGGLEAVRQAIDDELAARLEPAPAPSRDRAPLGGSEIP